MALDSEENKASRLPPELTFSGESELVKSEKRILSTINKIICSQEYGGDAREFASKILPGEEFSDEIVKNFLNGRLGRQNAINSYNWMRKLHRDHAWNVYNQIQKLYEQWKIYDPPELSPGPSGADFCYIGTVSQAIAEIIEMKDSIDEIWNTHIVSNEDVFYQDQAEKHFEDLFSAVLSRAGPITDVIGGDNHSGALKTHQEQVRKICKNKELRGSYHQYQVEPAPPTINFMILSFIDKDRGNEVYFGWGGYAHKRSGHVCWSRHKECVRMYEALHQSLVALGKKTDP